MTINIDLISSLVGEKWVSLFPVSGPDGRIGFHEKKLFVSEANNV